MYKRQFLKKYFVEQNRGGPRLSPQNGIHFCSEVWSASPESSPAIPFGGTVMWFMELRIFTRETR